MPPTNTPNAVIGIMLSFVVLSIEKEGKPQNSVVGDT